MSIESLIEDSGQQATITSEATRGQVPGQTAMGGADRSNANWATVADGVPCLVNPKGSSLDRNRNDARANVINAEVFFLADPVPGGMSSRHRITVTLTDRPDPVVLGVYAVTGVVDPNYLGRIFVADCERIRTP